MSFVADNDPILTRLDEIFGPDHKPESGEHVFLQLDRMLSSPEPEQINEEAQPLNSGVPVPEVGL